MILSAKIHDNLVSYTSCQRPHEAISSLYRDPWHTLPDGAGVQLADAFGGSPGLTDQPGNQARVYPLIPRQDRERSLIVQASDKKQKNLAMSMAQG